MARYDLRPKTLVIYNTEYEGSEEVADYYVAARPGAVKYAVSLAQGTDTCQIDATAQIMYGTAVNIQDQYIEPLQAAAAGYWYLVFCYGTPHKFYNDYSLQQYQSLDAHIGSAVLNTPVRWNNPLYLRKTHFLGDDAAWMHGRIDGRTVADAKALVDNAIYGETYWRSRLTNDYKWRGHDAAVCYFDRDSDVGEGVAAYRTYDAQIQTAADDAAALGYTTSVDTDPATATSFPNCLYYIGWYSGGREGVFTFKQGAVGYHIQSGTLTNLKSADYPYYWVEYVLSLGGLAGTFGWVAEPTLTQCAEPDTFTSQFLRGFTLGEAFNYNTAWVKGESVLIGDPLYNPTTGEPAVYTTPSEGTLGTMTDNTCERCGFKYSRRSDFVEQSGLRVCKRHCADRS